MPRLDNMVTDVAGIRVGHAHDAAVMSGVTAILVEQLNTAASVTRGGAPGTRDTTFLQPEMTAQGVDALVLSGGSAFGLDAAGGVMSVLRQRSVGIAIGPARIPLVAQAITFDLLNGGTKDWGHEPPYWKLGQRAADTGEVVFEDVHVPQQALLGAEGEGFKIAMRTFDRSRPEIAAIAVGISQRALDEATRYAKERQQFGQAIAQFQAVQFMLADMAIEIEAMRLLTHKAAWTIDHGAPASIVSSYAKAFGADQAMRITVDAVQIFGGYGYMKEYPVEKLMRDAKLLQIYEGTSQVQRVVIARNLLKS